MNVLLSLYDRLADFCLWIPKAWTWLVTKYTFPVPIFGGSATVQPIFLLTGAGLTIVFSFKVIRLLVG